MANDEEVLYDGDTEAGDDTKMRQMMLWRCSGEALEMLESHSFVSAARSQINACYGPNIIEHGVGVSQ